MKQRKYGQKVQNWHRPLAPRQLERWFRRHRHDALPDEDDWDTEVRHADYFSEESLDLRSLELKQLCREIVRRPTPLFSLERAMDGALHSEGECAVAGREDLELDLALFTQTITYFPNHPSTIRQIREAIGEDVYLDVITSSGRLVNGQLLVQNLCLFAPFWIRSPRTWTGGKVSLVDHLLVRYEVPRFLYPEWSEIPQLPRLKWLCWFILFAQGGSLRRAAGLFDWNIPSRFEHFLRMASPGASLKEACGFAEIMRLGGSPIDCRRILSNPAFVVDPTEIPEDEALSEFWETTVRWLIAHSTAITDEQSEVILAWAMHEYTETERRGTQPFYWKGRGLRSVLQRSLDHQRRLERPWSCHSWPRHGWDWQPIDAALDGWRFVELTSGEELFREGQAMRHCVAGYASRCAAGQSAIVSVRFKDARRITVEIIPATGQVVQARGACNRPADHEEQRMIRHWVDAVVRPNLP